MSTLREPPLHPSPMPITIDPGAEATKTSFMSFGRNKGVGKDGIPAELLVAGGSAVACKYSE
eukprot:1658771-Karenia_brevis.AAC.1